MSQNPPSSPSPLPPPPLPPPPPPPPLPLASDALMTRVKKLYQIIAERRGTVEEDFNEVRAKVLQRESSFRKDLQWVLFNKYVPSVIQDGVNCGIAALCMAAHQLKPAENISMERAMHAAQEQGFTAQGEMFSASDMAVLAEELCGCSVQWLSGGMMGSNSELILKHLIDGQPVLIPYDEDFNHEPCLRSGHKAHWAVASGVLLGLGPGTVSEKHFPYDPIIHWLHVSQSEVSSSEFPVNAVEDVYIFAKQGKSLRYQLWKMDQLAQSNSQLRELDPQRACDGTVYVLPPGGVEEGLAGQVVLLNTSSETN